MTVRVLQRIPVNVDNLCEAADSIRWNLHSVVDSILYSTDTCLRIINEIRKIMTEIERRRLEIVLLEVGSQSRTQQKPTVQYG